MLKKKNFYFTADIGGESAPSQYNENNTIYYINTGQTRLRSYVFKVRTYRTNNSFSFSWDLPKDNTLSIYTSMSYGPNKRKSYENFATIGSTQGSQTVYIDDPTLTYIDANISYRSSTKKSYNVKGYMVL